MSTETKEINLHVEKGQNEVTILHGEASPVMPFRKPLNISGNIDLPRLHLENHSGWLIDIPDESIDSPLAFSYVKIDRDAMSIEFVEDQGNPWESSYKGQLKHDPRFEKFGINSGKSYTTLELADFFKMNRSLFEKKDEAMRLVKELRNFKAKVDKDLENADDGRGNRKFLIAEKVDSNIPEAFNLHLPVFKGQEKQTITVEIGIGTDYSCTLISPDVADYIEEIRDKIMNTEIDKIKDQFSVLRVFEV